MQASQIGVVGLPQARNGGGVRSTVVHAFVAALMWLTPIVFFFVPAAFISSGLRNGWKGIVGSVLGAAAMLSVFLIGASTAEVLLAEASHIVLLVAEFGIAAAVTTMMIRRGARSGNVLLAGVGSSAAGFSLAELLFRGLAGHSLYSAVIEEFRTNASMMVTTWRARGATEDVLRAMSEATDTLANTFVPSMLLIGMTMSFALSLATIPRIPAGAATGSAYLFRTIRFPDWLLVVFVIAGLSPLASGALRLVGFNILATVVFLYVLQGLSIFRSLLVNLQLGFFGVLLAFVLLLFMSQYFVSPALLFLAGLFDPFFDFRKIHRKDETHESDSD